MRVEFLDPAVGKLLIQMWSISGDFISKIYAGTHSVLGSLTNNGKTAIERLDHGVTSVRRFLRQNLSDDFRQECTLILSAQHPLCYSLPTNFVQSVVVKEIESFSENSNVLVHITTLNCAGRQPDTYKELVPIFKSQ